MCSRIYLLGLSLSVFLLAGSAVALPCAVTPNAAVRQWLRQQANSRPGDAGTFVLPATESMPALREGYVVQSVKTDPVLKSQWVMVANCGHPERPRIAVEIPSRRAKTDLAPRATSGQASLPPKISRIPITIPTASAANQNFIQRSPATPQAPSSASVSRPNPPSVSTPVTPVLVRAGDRVVLWSQEPQLRLEIEAVALEYGRAGQVIHLRRNRETALLSGVVRGPGSVELMP